jgi:hypothetical protein
MAGSVLDNDAGGLCDRNGKAFCKEFIHACCGSRGGDERPGDARLSGFPGNLIPAFIATISNAANAQRLFATLLALPVDKNPYRSCLLDAAVSYRITFYNGSAVKLMAWVKPDGRANAKIGASSVIYSTTEQFWLAFASALGISESALRTWTPSSGPDAPAPGPNDWVTPFDTSGN